MLVNGDATHDTPNGSQIHFQASGGASLLGVFSTVEIHWILWSGISSVAAAARSVHSLRGEVATTVPVRHM